jgi:hypothetical protein
MPTLEIEPTRWRNDPNADGCGLLFGKLSSVGGALLPNCDLSISVFVEQVTIHLWGESHHVQMPGDGALPVDGRCCMFSSWYLVSFYGWGGGCFR